MRHLAPMGVAAMTLYVALALPAARANAQTHQHYKNVEEADRPAPGGELAPRLLNLGAHTFPAPTCSDRAQEFINQGVNLAYGFNHAEAGRSFREAARLDPNCAMAYWGQALVLGPNINATMDPNDEPRAHELIQQAVALQGERLPAEQAYIDALAQRYSGKAADRAARDRAYAAAMREVSRRFPDDLDAATLYAESVMDLRPWGYWMPDGRPYEGTAEIVKLLESVTERNPDHPGALHFYIHLMEAPSPARAEAAADRLLPLMPAAGHMVHMPSHIYQRVGRYADAVRSNQLAVQADEDYITQCRVQGLYPMGYYPHNIHFLWWAATMDGQRGLALESARKVASRIPDEALTEMPMLAGFRVIPYYALVRFGLWDELLKRAGSPGGQPVPDGNLALRPGPGADREGPPGRRGPFAGGVEADCDRQGARYPRCSRRTRWPRSCASRRRSWRARSPPRARTTTRRSPTSNAPSASTTVSSTPSRPSGSFPPRHALAAVLLEAGRPKEAETVYWEDLRRNPENGWALRGLADALRVQGRGEEAKVVEERFKTAWTRADFALTGSRLR